MDITDFFGKIFVEIDICRHEEEVKMIDENGNIFLFLHYQDCCESVRISKIVGNIEDLLNSPIITCSELIEDTDQCSESGTITIYTFSTEKGEVEIHWIGESNGYYSERVSISYTANKEETK